jgi:hypothetical protein
MEVAMTAVMMVEIMAMTTPSDCIRCVVKLVITPSRSLCYGRRMFPSHGSDEAAYGGLRARSRRRLQVPKP